MSLKKMFAPSKHLRALICLKIIIFAKYQNDIIRNQRIEYKMHEEIHTVNNASL